jgi:hypothetical protein
MFCTVLTLLSTSPTSISLPLHLPSSITGTICGICPFLNMNQSQAAILLQAKYIDRLLSYIVCKTLLFPHKYHPRHTFHQFFQIHTSPTDCCPPFYHWFYLSQQLALPYIYRQYISYEDASCLLIFQLASYHLHSAMPKKMFVCPFV